MEMNDNEKSYVPDKALTDFRNVVSMMADLNEAFDMSTLIARLNKSIGDVAKNIKAKRIEIETVPAGVSELDLARVTHLTVFETEGPEFDSISYECLMPDGETVRCSVTIMTLYPEEIQVQKAKWLCEMICLYVSRAKLGSGFIDLMNRDTDTGLPNMQTFLDFGEKLFAEFKISDYCVVALNINNFKFVNQTVPFDVGTSVLVKYAHKLSGMIKEGEIVTRFGGDNFNVLLKKKNLEKFLNEIKKVPIDIKDGNLRVHFELSCYAGIYMIESRTAIQAAVERASDAKNNAKKYPHHPFVYYNEEMGEKQHYSNQVRAKFGKAIDMHEFVAYYQPKVNIKTKKIIGMEALVRWETDGEVIRPDRFVGILEDSSSIIELDRSMLRQVCRDIKRWESMDIDVPRVSVNLSRRNLTTENIADEIASVLDEYHVDHSKVEIEVTETVDNAEFNFLADFIGRMKQHGIKVSIDDFGTGYSSLNLLKSLNADVLKIDRSFIDMEEFSEQDELLVTSIIDLAKAYNMEVITEGVETEEQMAFLARCGCENVQGYFFDMPMSKEEVTEIIRKGYYEKEYKL